MAIHDWTLVGAGIFHHFHRAWIGDLTRTLNAGLLPGGYYALAEQIAGGLGPDVLALEGPSEANSTGATSQNGGGIAVAVSPPAIIIRPCARRPNAIRRGSRGATSRST